MKDKLNGSRNEQELTNYQLEASVHMLSALQIGGTQEISIQVNPLNIRALNIRIYP